MAIEDEARQMYDEAIVIDGLNVSNWNSPAVYDSLYAGGVTAINATIAIWEGYPETLDHIATWLGRFRKLSDKLLQIKTVDDIHLAKQRGKTGVMLGWQNASPIGNRLDRLELFYALGVRIIQLTYNERNLLGNGCYERTDGGLSHFGVEAVREMNRLGILIDLSHVGEPTMQDAIEVSDKPVACTHANARAHFDHVRNKTDDTLRRIAEKGGVIGANAFPLFLPAGFESTVDDFVDVIEDLISRVGIDHVGIGTDYTQDQPPEFFEWLFMLQGSKTRDAYRPLPDPLLHPKDMETPDKLRNLAAALLRRGQSEVNIRKILGGNWLRLLQEVWSD